jgi:Domain of unknown function (DUF397)
MTLMELFMDAWRKSSRSGSNEGSCVEVTPAWRKSSRSGSNEGTCVEVAPAWRAGDHRLDAASTRPDVLPGT